MRSRNTILIAAAGGVAAVALTAGAVLATGAGSDDGPDVPITGEALVRAGAAALAHTGGGRVTETEVGDEESYYEVEVTLPDGRQVDVQLDRDFKVAGSSADEEKDGEKDGDKD